jgi:ABC-type branched-subunit amino acid transport system ATPase component
MNVGRKIAEGPPSAVLTEKEVVRAYLGGADA